MADGLSKFVCIRNAPLDWNEGFVTRKFSQYGNVEEVTIRPPLPHASHLQQQRFIIIEFENEEDAEAAVEGQDGDMEEYKVTFHHPLSDDTASSYVLTESLEESGQEIARPNVKIVHCSNSNCTKAVLLESEAVYCSPDCFFCNVDMTGRVDMYDKWISSMGRSGTGLLLDRTKIDKLVITVDPEGYRSSMYFPKT